VAYWITRFGSTNLPTRAQTQDVGTGEARSGLVTLPDGSAFDARGTATTRVTPWELSVSGAIEASTPGDLLTAGSALYGLIGRSDYLYRTPDGGTANSQRLRARCLRVDVARDVRHRLWAEPTLVFEVQGPVWSGTADVTAIGTFTSGGTLNVSNAGNAPVWDPVFTIVSSGAAITSLVLRQSTEPYAAELCFGTAYGTGTSGGTLPAGGTLIIDCGEYSVSNNGTNAYSRFELGSNHHIDGWAQLMPSPSATEWVVTFNGGASAVVSCTYRSAYA
jgi:hypothetical protein